MTHLTDLPRPLVMAHRGDAVHAPENSPAAFRLALERGADALETDLWRTSDGVLVCHHHTLIAAKIRAVTTKPVRSSRPQSRRRPLRNPRNRAAPAQGRAALRR